MTVVGGARARLISDNIYFALRDALDGLGWMKPKLPFGEKDFEFIVEEPKGEILPNKAIMSAEDLSDPREFELGNYEQSHGEHTYIDIYGESKVLARHLARDFRDILLGKVPDTRFNEGGLFEVYDLSASGLPHLCDVEIGRVEVSRSRSFNSPHQQYWWVVGFVVVDRY